VQNALKHSVARHVSVELRGTGDGVTLVIADDGIGFDADQELGKGLGLISMVERLESIGGKLTIRSKPGAGTTLEIHAPLPVAEASQHVG